jgi:glucose 1-dehydrogenase
MKLEGKVALVTGSGQGIGQAIAERLAAAGASIIVNYRSDLSEAEETKAKVEAAGSEGFIVKADMGVVSDVQNLVQQAIDHFGQLDILVNNAGIEKEANFCDVTEADYDAVMNINLKGAFFATQALVKHLLATKRPGKIINISSVHEELPFPNFTTYCASKGGLKMMTRNLAVELGCYGININNVAPGAIHTPINDDLLDSPNKMKSLLQNIPLGRIGQPKDVASLVAFLASADADYITGTTFFVDGGLMWNYREK